MGTVKIAFLISLISIHVAKAATVDKLHLFAEGSNYLDLRLDQDADETKVELSGPQIATVIGKGALAVILHFKTNVCTFRPADQIVMDCQPKGAVEVTVRDNTGKENSNLSVGKVHWASFVIYRLHYQFTNPANDMDQLHYEGDISAENIAGIIAYLDSTSLQFSVK